VIPCSLRTASSDPRHHPYSSPCRAPLHFPVWSPDRTFLYFVEGALQTSWTSGVSLNRWRSGTYHHVECPINSSRILRPPTILFSARRIPTATALRLYSTDVERRIPHRLSSGLDRYTSLAASADGRHLVATAANTKRTLWRLPISSSNDQLARRSFRSRAKSRRRPGSMFSPRIGPRLPSLRFYSASPGDSIWKLANGTATQLWSGQGATILGGPAIAPDGRNIAFSARKAEALSYTSCRPTAPTRESSPTRSNSRATPPGRLTANPSPQPPKITAYPTLFRVFLDGRPPTAFVQGYSLDPSWSPDGKFAVYSGPDIGNQVCGKRRYARSRAASPAGLDPNSRCPAPRLPAARTLPRVPARRNQTQESLAHRP